MGFIFQRSRACNFQTCNSILQKFELGQDFMHFLFTYRYEEDLIKNGQKKLVTLICHFVQGHTSHGWLVQSWKNSNLIKTLCLSWFPASKKRLRFKMAEKVGDIVFPLLLCVNFFQRSRVCNSQTCGPILLKFGLGQDFMLFLLTYK